MRRSLRARAGVAGTTLAALLLLPATAAWAHASFDIASVPAGTTQQLTVRVPVEREADNDRLDLLVPDEFDVVECSAPAGWTCTAGRTDDDADEQVTYVRDADGDGSTERFGLTLTAPAQEGTYVFPAVQRYSDGEEAAWIGAEGGDNPAPRLVVVEAAGSVELSDAPATHGTDDAGPDDSGTLEVITPVTESPDAPTGDAAGPDPSEVLPEPPVEEPASDGLPVLALVGIALTAGLGLLVVLRGRS